MDTLVASEVAWKRAQDRDTEDLTEDEKRVYYQASLENIFYTASAVDKSHEAKSVTRRAIAKLQPLLSAIEQYGEALDVYTNACPLVLSPLWGSLRVIIHLASEFNKYFEKLLDMFARVGDVLPRFRIFERLFGNHERLVQALSTAYVDILHFCSEAKAVFRHGKRIFFTNSKIFGKLTWKPFEQQFGRYLDAFREHRKSVEKEAGISHMIEAAGARTEFRDNQVRLHKEHEENLRMKALTSLSSVDQELKHLKLQKKRYQGSGEWFFRHQAYLEWMNSRKAESLCCHGIPGSGKSVLASIIIDRLATFFKSTEQKIVYYYYDYTDQRTLHTIEMLGSLMKQLLLQGIVSPEIERRVIAAVNDKVRAVKEDDLCDMLCSAIHECPNLHIILDGVDECEKISRDGLLRFLRRLASTRRSILKILVICRHEDQMLQALDGFCRVPMTAAAVAQDITSYVTASVKSLIQSKEMAVSNSALEDEIIKELIAKAQGMKGFLWVFFQLEELCEASSDAELREILSKLPEGLGETFERILVKIAKSPVKAKLACKVLNWTLCAKRPLHIAELQEAVAFDESDTAWSKDKIPDKILIVGSCRRLVASDGTDQTVRFVHPTVQQYLLSRRIGVPSLGVSLRVAELSAARLCVTYLSFTDFETSVIRSPPEVQFAAEGIFGPGGPGHIPSILGLGRPVFDMMYRVLGGRSRGKSLGINYAHLLAKPKTETAQIDEKCTLLNYVIQNWTCHTKVLAHEGGDSKTFESFIKLVQDKNLAFEFRPWGSNKHCGPYGCTSCPIPSSGEPEPRDLTLTSLYHWASQYNHSHILDFMAPKYLMHERYSHETLRIACRHGQTEAVESILRHSTARSAASGDCVMEAACASGNVSTIEALVAVNNYKISDRGYALLNKAASNGDEAMMKYLLESGAQCRCDKLSGWEPIHFAASNGHANIVRTLIAGHSSPDAKDMSGKTAMNHAAENGHEEVVTILMNGGARLNCTKVDLAANYERSTGAHLQYYGGSSWARKQKPRDCI